MSSGRLRLFFALWPDGEAAATTHALARTLCKGGPARLVAAERLHMTLQFLGSQAPEAVAGIRAAASGVRGRPFVLTLARCGLFKRAGAAWLAPGEAPAELLELVAGLRQALAAIGIAAETRPFRPHVTIARRARGVPSRALDSTLRWELDHFRLVQSVTRASGAEYSEIARWPLAG